MVKKTTNFSPPIGRSAVTFNLPIVCTAVVLRMLWSESFLTIYPILALQVTATSAHCNRLDHGILVRSVLATLSAKPALLHTSKRCRRITYQSCVHPDHAHFKCLCNPPYSDNISAKEVTG